MKIKPTAEAGQVLVQLDRKDEALLDQAAALNRARGGLHNLKKILAPVDFSRCSREALEVASSFAQQLGASLTVLHIIVPFFPIDPYGVDMPDCYGPDLKLQAQKKLDCLVREAVPPEVPSQSMALLGQGRPAHEIIQAAREMDADMIIIPTHGYTGLKHVVFGSTAEYVVRHATCPVLTLRAKDHKPNE